MIQIKSGRQSRLTVIGVHAGFGIDDLLLQCRSNSILNKVIYRSNMSQKRLYHILSNALFLIAYMNIGLLLPSPLSTCSILPRSRCSSTQQMVSFLVSYESVDCSTMYCFVGGVGAPNKLQSQGGKSLTIP